MAALRFVVIVAIAAAVGTLACLAVMKLMSDEFRPAIAAAVGGAAGASAVLATLDRKPKGDSG